MQTPGCLPGRGSSACALQPPWLWLFLLFILFHSKVASRSDTAESNVEAPWPGGCIWRVEGENVLTKFCQTLKCWWLYKCFTRVCVSLRINYVMLNFTAVVETFDSNPHISDIWTLKASRLCKSINHNDWWNDWNKSASLRLWHHFNETLKTESSAFSCKKNECFRC